jgi:hypothetical protein
MKTGSLLVLMTLAVLVAGACDTTPVPAACTDIPDGGCPEDNGATVCVDPTCDAVYACSNGKWVFVQKCPPHPDDAGAPVEASPTDATVPDVAFDAPPGSFGGPGCTDLETPDCSVGTALACVSTADCCGCQDLWVCQNAGWVLWGTCADGGLAVNMK